MTFHPVGREFSSLAVCGLMLAVALAGCTQKSQTETKSTAAEASAAAVPTIAAAVPTTAAAQTTTAAAPAAATAAADAAATPASAATVAAAAANPALTSDGDQAGTKVIVNSLARGSDTVTLKLTLVNDSATTLESNKFNGQNYRGYHSMSGVHLIDTVSKKKYFPVADTDGNCVCSNDVADIPSKSQVALWVKFPAPPATVKKITVEVPHFIPLDDVPIAQ